MSKVDEVARAAYAEAAKLKHGFWYEGLQWEDIPDLQIAFRCIARAAIEAMRVPTDRMFEAGRVSIFDPRVEFHDDAGLVWSAMIDAALAE